MKYILLNDVYYILKHKKKYLISFISFVLIILFLYKSSVNDVKELLNICSGINYSKNSSIFIELIIYIFNISTNVYLFFDIILKDIQYQLSNVFLRIKPCKWIYIKIGIVSTVMFILKVFEYLVIYISFKFSKFNTDAIYIMSVMLADYIYILLIQFICFAMYIAYNISKKSSAIILILVYIFISVYPKSILYTIKCIGYEIFIILVIEFIIYILFKKCNKVIIQKLGVD